MENFNITHPEIRVDEVWLVNASIISIEAGAYRVRYLRVGNTAFCANGGVLKGMVPIFHNKTICMGCDM